MSPTFSDTLRTTAVLGGKLQSHEAGEGPPLIMLHGGGPGANAWDNGEKLIGALSATFHVILLNMAGYGGSEQIDPLPGEFDDQFNSRVIRSFMDERGIATASVYGASGSGLPLVRLAIDTPDRVDKLILKGPGGLPSLFTPGPPPGMRALFAFLQDPTRENMAAVMHMFVPNPENFSEDMVDRRLDAALRVPRYQPAPYRTLTPMLGEITQPTLVLWGHQDNMVPFEGALAALNAIPDVRVHLWGGGVGHFVEWERPHELVRLITDFLSHSDR